ncbi:DUF2510 domain-containing protein [Mycolicibacterium sp. S2-37]|uniref:DUF2510 domain-containing protein n=1 Tax=Mycolicibacterium sp. S2-37 TaxID=2810297 RepID=UPI001A9411D4|nr:DUF2510 domain-containing protein [Mycolicibacterium sp. S2-37]MBO0678431.1 DUF2510 domain-containing protein [Mycolicibacterium sp. S2-37]
MPASKSETRVVPGAYDNVFRAVCDAARMEAMTVTLADPAAGVIQLSTDVSLTTWGEKLAVHLRPAPEGVEVTVHSALKFGLVDWGRNGQLINTLFHLVARVLAAPAGAWHPDPSGRHQSRWWDGSRWTEHVSDAGRVGVDPL